MKKGFTLIELLAVIVILAIISLIAIPIIVNIIEDSKEASRLRSAELYISTLNTSLVKQALKGPVPNGTYDVMNNGNLCLGEIQNNTCNGTEVKVEMEGTLPTAGSITIENGKIIDIQGLTIEGYAYGYDENNQISKLEGLKVTFNTNGGTEIASVYVKPGSKLTQPKNPQKHEYKFKEWKLNNTTYDFNTPVTSNITLTAVYEETELYTLKTGQNFNTTIKTLVKGSTVSSYYTNDNIVEYIEFYSNGELPEGYTLQQLQALPSTDVSEDDESIIAYYDSTKKSVYIYSEGEIVWNDNSDYMFYNFGKLKEFNIPYNVTSIGNYAFSGSGLTSITIPNNVTSIGDYAFFECSSLTSITIPDSVTSIGSYAFWNCSSLTSVTIGSGVTSIGEGAFRNCSSLSSIKVDTNNPIYEDRNSNAIIKKSNNELVVGCKNTIIPDSVINIGQGAFFECRSLSSITIPNSVTSIGTHAFYNCSSLTSITFNTPTGWWYADSADATSGVSLDLSNTSNNATYLKSTYVSKYWKRS